MTLPRLLVIMGSGETAPTMKTPHRRIFERLTAHGVPARPVMLDTPFGFQENASVLATTTTKYFSDSVSQDVVVAGLARPDQLDAVALESAMSRVRDANWVFAGPGSPTFALRQWRQTALRDVLADKLADGGALVFSSAAALTLGCVTVPVYEVYKVGMDPWWEAGLDLLAVCGINAAVVPHYDNQEGGNHDTRFCYLGERRLAMLEPRLPDGAFVLGIDEHTAVVFDLDADTAEIVGKGALTLRRNGTSDRYESGATIALDVVRSGGAERSATGRPDLDAVDAVTAGSGPSGHGKAQAGLAEAEPTATSLGAHAAQLEAGFVDAMARRDAEAAVGAILDLDTAITEWSADTTQSDQMDRAKRALRSMIVKLGVAAADGLRDEREVLGPVVEAALAARRVARTEKAYAVSDAVRDGLDAAGIEVRDTVDGVEWMIRT